MKQLIKRAACLSLATLMICSCFTGCDKKSKSASGESGSTVADKLRAELDFGGETINIVTPPGYGMVNTDGKDQTLVERDEKLEKLGKKYNATFKVIEGRGTYWDAMASSIAAGSPAGHIMVSQENYFMSWLKAGAMADLSAAMEKTGIDFTDERYSQVVRKYTNLNNSQYCFAEAPLYPSGCIWYFNKRIFSESNLGDPYEMVKNKTWTWDTVEDIAKKALKKKADGTVEQWGLSAYMHINMVSELCSSNGTTIANFDENGNPVLTLNESAAMKAFEKFYDWTVVQKIAKCNDGSQNWDTALREFTTGNIALMMGTNKLLQFIDESAMEDDFGILPSPMGPDVDDYYAGTSCGTMYFIPATYEDMADKLLLVMDELYDFGDSSYEEEITKKYISKMRDEESMQNYIDMIVNTEHHTHDAYVMTKIDWTSPSIHDLCSSVLKGVKTPGDALEGSKVQFQKAMEDTMEDYKVTGK